MPFVFTREEDALVLAFRFAGMAFYVNCGLRILQAAIGRPQKATTANRSLGSSWKSRLLRLNAISSFCEIFWNGPEGSGAAPQSAVDTARRPCRQAQLTSLLYNETLSSLVRPCVLRLDHAQPPSTSATTGRACQFLQSAQIQHRPSLPAAMLPNVCAIFAVCVWTSTFATSCASVLLLPSMLPPHECFPVGVFAAQCGSGRDKMIRQPAITTARQNLIRLCWRLKRI
jgi:hypothetical protein